MATKVSCDKCAHFIKNASKYGECAQMENYIKLGNPPMANSQFWHSLGGKPFVAGVGRECPRFEVAK